MIKNEMKYHKMRTVNLNKRTTNTLCRQSEVDGCINNYHEFLVFQIRSF